MLSFARSPEVGGFGFFSLIRRILLVLVSKSRGYDKEPGEPGDPGDKISILSML